VKIEIRDIQQHLKIDKKLIRKWSEIALRAMKEDGAELSLLFTDDAYIKRLNCKFLNVDDKTDVLAFPMREGEGLSKTSPILGDVVISVETAKRQAKKRKSPVKNEVCLYLVHGILHLLGYDDTDRVNKKKMKDKEKELISLMCK
jgi:probable rRNA maturation factor